MALRRKNNRKREQIPSPHDEYSVTCYCGEVLTGTRDDTSQFVLCMNCDEMLYVMPRDVYPRPKILAHTNSESVSEISPEEAASPQLSVTEIANEERLAEPVDNTPPRVWLDVPRGAEVRKRLFQVIATTAILLGLFILGLSYRKSLETQEELYLQHSRSAWDAVYAHDWEAARRSATFSVEAAVKLHRNDDASTALKHLQAELEILINLCSHSPFEIALDKQKSDVSAEEWPGLFRARYGNRWLIMQGTIQRIPPPDSDSNETYRFDYPMDLTNIGLTMMWNDSPEWIDQLTWKNDCCEILVAAELLDAQFSKKNSHNWKILLSAENSRLWRTTELLEEFYGLNYAEDAPELGTLASSQRLTAPYVREERPEEEER